MFRKHEMDETIVHFYRRANTKQTTDKAILHDNKGRGIDKKLTTYDIREHRMNRIAMRDGMECRATSQ